MLAAAIFRANQIGVNALLKHNIIFIDKFDARLY